MSSDPKEILSGMMTPHFCVNEPAAASHLKSTCCLATCCIQRISIYKLRTITGRVRGRLT